MLNEIFRYVKMIFADSVFFFYFIGLGDITIRDFYNSVIRTYTRCFKHLQGVSRHGFKRFRVTRQHPR